MITIVRFKQDVYIGPDGLPTTAGDGVLHHSNGHEKIIVQKLRDLLDKHGIEYDVLLEASEDEFGKKFKQEIFRGT